jgi:hypothetical protein
MTNDRQMLEQLRVSLARMAQAEKLDRFIPGVPEEGAPMEVLDQCAKIDTGWNRLVAALLAASLMRA